MNEKCSDSDDMECQNTSTISDEQVYDALGIVIMWQSQGNIDPAHFLLVNKWRAIAGTQSSV